MRHTGKKSASEGLGFLLVESWRATPEFGSDVSLHVSLLNRCDVWLGEGLSKLAPVEIRAWSPQNDPLKTSFSQDRQINPPKLTADWQNRGPSDPNSERAVHFSTAGLELTNPGCGPSHSRATYLSNRVHGGQSQNDRRLGWAFSRNNQMKRISVGHFRRT